MLTDAFRISALVSALPERVYSAWLDSAAHSAFTGGEAKVDPAIGGRFTAWDGYIQGRTLELLAGRRIVQTWRTKVFPQGSPDSRLEVQLEPAEGGTRITILHSGIPEGQGEKYKQGWADKYFHPMKEYFARRLANPRNPMNSGAAPRPKKAEVAAKPAAPKPATKPSVKKAAPKLAAPARKAAPKKKVASGKARKVASPRHGATKSAARRPAKKKGRKG